MKYDIQFTNQFKKDLKLAKKQNKNLDKLFEVIDILANGGTLEAKYRDHDLTGNYTAGESLKSAGDKVSSAGEKLLPASAAVTALGVAAVKTASDFDSSMSQVAAMSGATGEDFDKLRAKAREMGAKTKFSASEAADAMNYMAMAGWKTSDMLDGIEGIMNLAAASGEDLATTSDIVTDLIRGYNLTHILQWICFHIKQPSFFRG